MRPLYPGVDPVLGVLPVCVLGTLAFHIRPDPSADTPEVGFATPGFFLGSALG